VHWTGDGDETGDAEGAADGIAGGEVEATALGEGEVTFAVGLEEPHAVRAIPSTVMAINSVRMPVKRGM
jgi:hypothetical protein